MNHLGEHAVVIGGSIAGLMAGRVLADHYTRVSIIERDATERRPALRKSVPQGAHIHALLLGGEQVMAQLYPGFTDTMLREGAVRLRAGRDVAYFLPGGKAYSPGGAMKQPRDLGFDLYGASRELIEHCIRQHTRKLRNVSFETATVSALVMRGARIRGVRAERDGGWRVSSADLVVDASGRGSRLPKWLTEIGFAPPAETLIGVDMAYASARFRIAGYAGEPEKQLLFRGPAPHHRRSAIIGMIENDTWHVTLAGRFGEDPPFDEAGFLEFAASLHAPRLHELIANAERVSEIVQYQFPTSVQRHYERFETFPDGLLVLGDAMCSFNPIYGQGMSVAALQCRVLQRLLAERSEAQNGAPVMDGLAAAFFDEAAQVSQQAWTLAANQDFAFPQTRGARPQGLAERAAYGAALDALIPEDPQVHRLLAEVVNLARPLSMLSEEPLRSRALARVRA